MDDETCYNIKYCSHIEWFRVVQKKQKKRNQWGPMQAYKLNDLHYHNENPAEIWEFFMVKILRTRASIFGVHTYLFELLPQK